MQPISDELDARITKLENELVRIKAAKLEKLSKPTVQAEPVRWAVMSSTKPTAQHAGDGKFYVWQEGASGWIMMGPTQSDRDSAVKAWNTGVQFLNVNGRLPDVQS